MGQKGKGTLLSKAEAGYRAPDLRQPCWMCLRFDGYLGAWSIVEGTVRPDATCGHWRSVEDQAPEQCGFVCEEVLMRTLRIEIDRGHGWQLRAEGKVPAGASIEQIQRDLRAYALQYPHRAQHWVPWRKEVCIPRRCDFIR